MFSRLPPSTQAVMANKYSTRVSSDDPLSRRHTPQQYGMPDYSLTALQSLRGELGVRDMLTRRSPGQERLRQMWLRQSYVDTREQAKADVLRTLTRMDRSQLDCRLCTDPELKTFVKNRGLGGRKNMNKTRLSSMKILKAADDKAVFPFMELPPELRNMVYCYYIGEHDNRDQHFLDVSTFPKIASIAHISKMIRAETLAFLFQGWSLNIVLEVSKRPGRYPRARLSEGSLALLRPEHHPFMFSAEISKVHLSLVGGKARANNRPAWFYCVYPFTTDERKQITGGRASCLDLTRRLIKCVKVLGAKFSQNRREYDIRTARHPEFIAPPIKLKVVDFQEMGDVYLAYGQQVLGESDTDSSSEDDDNDDGQFDGDDTDGSAEEKDG